MPRKKKQTTTFSASVTSKNGSPPDTMLRILALFFWDEKLQTYTLYGLTECSPSYQKMVKSICHSFTEHEEIELRLQACGEVLCADVYFKNGRFQRCDVRLDSMPPAMLEKFRSNIDQFVLAERRDQLIEREQEELDSLDLDDSL